MKILAVEDETAVARMLALVLGGPSCKVTTAADGEKALAKIAATPGPFDVVITDHKMPRASGLELVRQLRARNFAGKILVLSAHLSEGNVQAYQELNVDLMVSKPFDIDQLRRAVETLGNQASLSANPTPD